MNPRTVLLAVAAYALCLPACTSPACGYVNPISDTSSGTISYAPTGRTCGGDILAGGTFQIVGSSDYAGTSETGPTATAAGSGTVQVVGGFDDGTPSIVDFTLTATSISSGTSTLGPGSQLCVTNPDNACEPCMPITGALAASTYSNSCYSNGCTLDIDGTLTATATGSQGTFSFTLALVHKDEWVSQACSSDSDGL